jgi:nifR3 family TIM-barrel protein
VHDLSHLIDKKLWLAPLAGYTDQGFRRTAKDWGVDVLVSEMVSADGLIRDSRKTIDYLLFTEAERPFGIQIFGSNALIMAQAAEFCLRFSPDFIDINMGCPVKKVVKRGAGSALMRNPEIASHIVKECKRALGDTIPLSVKFRSGWDNSSLNYLDFGVLMQDSGADFLCLHPRTQKQMFSGKSNWEHIKLLKQQLQIPLIGNGDIGTPELVMQMYKETACDSIMIGRGALGRPWIFEQTKELQAGNSYGSITIDQLKAAVLAHIDYALQHKPEHVVVREMRSQICHYTKGLNGGAELRRKVNQAKDSAELRQLIQEGITDYAICLS